MSLCVTRANVSVLSNLVYFCSFIRQDARMPGPPPSAYKAPVLSTGQLGQAREKFCSQRKVEAPSTGGNPQKFLNGQDKDGCIPCNRPYGCPTALPLSLLHPTFGEFIDDAENYVPTSDDAKFLLAFVKAMTDIYEVEDDRKKTLLTVFNDHKIHIKPTMIGRFTTDGDLYTGKFRFLIGEFKNEIGSKAAEPFFQAILYFLEATRELATRHLKSVLPCIILLIFGSFSFLIPALFCLILFRPLCRICRRCMD
jgi:hypothetical protein